MPSKLLAMDRLDRRITVRLTKSQYDSIAEEAELSKLPVSVYARHLILSRRITFAHPIVLEPQGIEPAVAALGRVGNNVNQIARWLNRHTTADEP